MNLESLENPYRPGLDAASIPPATSNDTTDAPAEAERLRCAARARLYLICALVLLLVATWAFGHTMTFVVRSIQAGNVPAFGIFMAATVRFILCLTNAVPGVLLLLAARSAQRVANGQEKTLKNFRRLQMIVLLGAFLILAGLAGLIILFFISLGMSNM